VKEYPLLMTDAPVIKLSEIEQALVSYLPLEHSKHAHILLELTPEEFVSFSSQHPVGLVLALDIVLRHMHARHKLSTNERYALQRFLWKGLSALRFMQEEIEQCIKSLE
jgi:hypothetical protein